VKCAGLNDAGQLGSGGLDRVEGFVPSIGTAPTTAGRATRAAVESGDDDSWSERRARCEYCRCSFLLGPEGKRLNCGPPA
jgi:hypothetical protein